ncbi:hypothetical protein [Mongoliitalea lutea]|uniref:Uncharacterized protein n=1 Tax=Mongoliitalea lutea TaxID=849756 RepID=A0A8J3G4U8_9BACT|nr:hypothetical protein [Mongoliitalea lutea]GHB30919.1 hypothetical protein GCM10008106_09770 [Mongoliitalea lutea]
MNKKEFDQFIKTYEEGLKKGIIANDIHGRPIKEQSSYVYFDKKSLEKFLEQVDDNGGIRIYFGQYDELTIKSLPASIKDPTQYFGRLSVVLATDDKFKKDSLKSSDNDDDDYYNGGDLCPPTCR